MVSDHKHAKETLVVPEFPGTRPKTDEMKTYIDAFEDVAATRGLGHAANGGTPDGELHQKSFTNSPETS
jgi:hypothetical protein